MDPQELQALKSELARMQARVDELEQTSFQAPSSRRHMLRGLGVAAAGAAVGGLAFARPASAADGGNVVIGAQNTSNSPTWIVRDPTTYSSSDDVGLFHLTDDSSQVNIDSTTSLITAVATGTHGFDTVLFAKGSSYGAKIDSPVPLKLIDSSTTQAAAPATGGSGSQGQFRVHGNDLWFCTSGSISDPVVWRKLAGNSTAGSYHPITPHRVYNSTQGSGGGPLAKGSHRDISVANGIKVSDGTVDAANLVPATATAIHCNVSVINTVGNGYLTVNPGGTYTVTSSIHNWTSSGQTLNNAVTLTLNSSRQLALVCGGHTGASTNIVIDVLGYYL